MIKLLYNHSIRISHGDIFRLNVEITEFEPLSGYTYWLAVKKKDTVMLELQATVVSIEGGVNLHFEANTEQMKALQVDDYVYDIYVKDNSDNIVTCMFAAGFAVERIAHNV